MLRHLSLKDFVIVPTLELDFEPGFAVLTGETGAGKSILIDALQLALVAILAEVPHRSLARTLRLGLDAAVSALGLTLYFLSLRVLPI